MRNETVREEDEGPARKKTPATLQKTYIRRAEKEIASEGGYSWVSDIRNRVTVAKHSPETRTSSWRCSRTLEVDVSQNSEKSWRRDWIYSLADHPTWRIGARSWASPSARRRSGGASTGSPHGAPPRRPPRDTLHAAESAIELNDLSELERLSGAIETFMAVNAHSIADLDRRIERLEAMARRFRRTGELRARCAHTRRRTGSCPKPAQTRRQRRRAARTPSSARAKPRSRTRRGRPGTAAR